LSEISGAIGPAVRTPRKTVHSALNGLLREACAAPHYFWSLLG
jgi:hypothetical protein